MKKAFGIKLNSQENINKAFEILRDICIKLDEEGSSRELEMKFGDNLFKVIDVCNKKGFEIDPDFIDCFKD